MTIAIYRRADGKLLGEATAYGRSGGDLFAFPHPSSKTCPEHQSESDVIHRVFVLEREVGGKSQ